jgi:hypothetical protein
LAPPLLESARQGWVAQLVALGASEFDALMQGLAAHPRFAAWVLEHPEARALPERARVAAVLAQLPGAPAAGTPAEVGWVLAPVGHQSLEGTAVLGRGGHVFVVGGPNRPLDQALRDPASPRVQQEAAAWAAVLAGRVRHCAERGIGFLQILLPEKQSVLPEYLPTAWPTPIALWRALEQQVAAAPELAAAVMDALPVLQGPGGRAERKERSRPLAGPLVSLEAIVDLLEKHREGLGLVALLQANERHALPFYRPADKQDPKT